MKKETVNGVDIYIDREKEIIFIGMNEKISPKSKEIFKKRYENLTVKGYAVMFFESINEVKFLN